MLIGALLLALFASDPHGTVTTVECVLGGRVATHGEGPKGDFTTEYVGYEFEGNADSLIDWHIAVFGVWEPEVVAAMEDLLVLYRKNDGVVVDVGANIGTHSIYVAKAAQTVHAIEPWPPVIDRMHETLNKNKIENVIVHPVGFADKPGELEYNVPSGENLGMGTFSRRLAEERGFADVGKMMLPLVVGDDYFAEKKVERVDMIKADIEGYEKMAFIGLEAVMKRDRPIVLFELNVGNEEGFHSMEELESVFPDNYRFFALVGTPLKVWRVGGQLVTCGNPDGVYVIKTFHNDFEHGTGNVLAVPQELVERFDELPARAHIQL